MGVKLAPVGRKQFIDENGNPYSGAQVFYYVSGTTDKQDTFKTSAGTTANDNPLILDSKGQPANEIWFTEGISYKEVIATAGDTDPPASPLETNDNLTGINDFTSSSDEWVASGLTPTFISATSFSLEGDVTSTYHVGRRLKTVNSGGTVYSTITATAYTALTTVTVVNDSGVLDSGISAVSYGILSSVNPSVPKVLLPDGSAAETQAYADNSTQIATTAYVDSRADDTLNINPITGLTLSNGTDATNDIDIAVGYASDFANTRLMVGTAMTKQIDANWATGTAAGGFPSGLTLTNDTWYRVFLISTTAGVIDYGFDTSATAANLIADASSYTLYRQIGWIRYGTATILGFYQDGDLFLWSAPVSNFSEVPNSATAQTKTIAAPPSTVSALFVSMSDNSAGGAAPQVLFSSLEASDTAPSNTVFTIALTFVSATGENNGQSSSADVLTNSSSQIRYRMSKADAGITIACGSYGWTDKRGKG